MLHSVGWHSTVLHTTQVHWSAHVCDQICVCGIYRWSPLMTTSSHVQEFQHRQLPRNPCGKHGVIKQRKRLHDVRPHKIRRTRAFVHKYEKKVPSQLSQSEYAQECTQVDTFSVFFFALRVHQLTSICKAPDRGSRNVSCALASTVSGGSFQFS